ncbi:MAG: excinuclease ABC subunit UvrC [Lachnospiraceae bacterium]|nr:excinuclease ABC subunit UvrC [Lachnospiraceae bacterium]
MHGENDEIIYVGKAVSLRRRVRSYFRESTVKSSKIQKMVSHITRFEYIVTDSEMEALILECNLIKENSPKYNTMLKDDKSYPFIRVTVEEAYPRVLLTRHRVKDKSRYFGPYPSVGAVKETLDILQKVYHIRTCNRNLPKDNGKQRPCLNYQMKLCSGPCQGYISSEDYRKQIDKIVSFLEGNDLSLENTLKQKMTEAAEELEFERAAEYRDMLASVRAVREKQKITEEGAVERDVIGFARQNEEAVVQVFFIRGGKMIGREHFYLHVPEDEEDTQMLASFLKQYYGGTPFIPKELFLPVPLEKQDEADILGWLTAIRGRKVSAVYPKRGKKEQFVELAAKNARMILEKDREKIRREEARTLGAVHQIEEALGLYGIHRMEAYDISHISGTLSVGAMVVFEDGKPRRNDYRKFRLREVQGPDDYAAMHEVLTRRFTHGLRESTSEKDGDGKFLRFPELICMDGGKGQVNIALEVLEELGLDIPVCGMVKDDHHRTRGLYYKNVETPIGTDSEAFKLITRIQDEAHRFAITFHRSLRGKEQVHSVLDDIKGIGPARRRALMARFADIEAIREADVETLAATDTMNEAAARAVYDFFHKKSETNVSSI